MLRSLSWLERFGLLLAAEAAAWFAQPAPWPDEPDERPSGLAADTGATSTRIPFPRLPGWGVAFPHRHRTRGRAEPDPTLEWTGGQLLDWGPSRHRDGRRWPTPGWR